MTDTINAILSDFHLLRPLWLVLMVPALIMAALLLIGWFPEIVTYLPQTMSQG